METRMLVIVCAFCVFHILTYVQTSENAPSVASNSTLSKLKGYRRLSEQQQDGIVTLQFIADSNTTAATDVYRRIPGVIAKILNQEAAAAAAGAATAAPPSDLTGTTTAESDNTGGESWRRRRAAAEEEKTSTERYHEDGIGLVDTSPAIKDDKLRVALYAEDRDGTVLPAEQLKTTLENNKQEIATEIGLPVESVYEDMPADIETDAPHRATVWDLHWNMFMGVLALVGVALLILLLCCLCFYCCRRRRRSDSSAACGKQETKAPLPVDEMVELTPIVPLQSAPPPSYRDGPRSADDAAADEENGWIVPIDQLSPDELDQPDVQISKL